MSNHLRQEINGDANSSGHSNIVQLIQAVDGSTISNVIQQVFVGDYERLRDAYINPWPVFERVSLEYFVGREWLLAEVDTFLREHDRGYFILEADAGLGKTTFLAWLVKERGYIHHFVELESGLEGIGRGLKNLAAQLVIEYRLSAYEAEGVLPGAAARPHFLLNLLRQAADKRRDEEKVIVVIDALDEAETLHNHNVLGLPNVLPEGIYIIASQRPTPVSLHVDIATTPRITRSIAAASNTNKEDLRRFLNNATNWPRISQLLQESGISFARFVETLLEKSEGVWIYAHFVVHEIEAGQRLVSNLADLPTGLTQYYLHYWRNRRDQDVARWDQASLPLLSTLAAIQEPVTIDQLREWSAVEITERQIRRLLAEQWRPFLVELQRGQKSTYRFYHLTLNEFFEGRASPKGLNTGEMAFISELAEAAKACHARLSAYFLAQWGGLDEGLPQLIASHKPLDEYALRHLLWHLYRSGQILVLYQLVEQPAWATAKPIVSSRVASYFDDLNFAFQIAIDESDGHSIVKAMRYALQRELAQRQIGSSDEAIVLLAQLGKLEWALNLAAVKSFWKHVEVLIQLAHALYTRWPEQTESILGKLAYLADGTGDLFKQCVCRCKSALAMAKLGLTLEKAKSLVGESQVLAVSMLEPEASTYRFDWALPTIAATGDLRQAMQEAEKFPLPMRCELLRRFATVLPPNDGRRITLMEAAVDLSKRISEKQSALEQQAYSLVGLAELQLGQAREQTLKMLESVSDEIYQTHPESAQILSQVVQRMAQIDVARMRSILEAERWHPDVFFAWSAVVEATIPINVEEALGLLNEKMGNWAAYEPLLVKIIAHIAQEDLQRAESLVASYEDRLGWQLGDAHLALAKAHLNQGNLTEAEPFLFQPRQFMHQVDNDTFLRELLTGNFISAANYLQPEELLLWFKSLPKGGEGYGEARQVLAEAATYHRRHDLLDGIIYSEEDYAVVAATLARTGHVAEAKELVDKQHIRTWMEPGNKAHIWIVAAEAQDNPDALDDLIKHYGEAHNFCESMVQVPFILDGLLQSDRSKTSRIQGILEHIWPIALNWQAPESSEAKEQVQWKYRREQVLGQIVATMFRINPERGEVMLEELQDSPAEINALITIAKFRPPDANFIEEFKVKVQGAIEDPYERAAAYYDLALALPASRQEEMRTMVSEAEAWFIQKPVYAHVDHGMRTRYEISASALRLLKVRVLIKFIAPNGSQREVDEIITLVDQAATFLEKRHMLQHLFEYVEDWPVVAQTTLLTCVLKNSVNKGLNTIQATIAASAPILHARGGFALLNELWQEFPLAYQSVRDWVETSRNQQLRGSTPRS